MKIVEKEDIVEIPSFDVVYWSGFCEVIEVAQKAEESTNYKGRSREN